MRINTSSIAKNLLLISAASLLGLSMAYGQSSQYKRKSAPKKKATKARSKAKATNQKLNLEDLEKRYWAPKDTEFKVVQNRKFKKAKRYNITAMGGVLFNDPFISGTNLGLSTAYYFDEHNGIEVRYEHYTHTMGEAGDQVIEKGGRPDLNFEKWYLGASYTWIPFYGKISVLDSKIIYFDMAFSAGLGLIQYEQQSQIASAVKTKNALALNLDVSQQFFIHRNWALRLDARTKVYQEDRVRNSDGVSLGAKTQFNTYIMFGATYFFDGKGEKK